MYYERPSGVMHEVIKKATDDLRAHNNPYVCIQTVSAALNDCKATPILQKMFLAANASSAENNNNNNNNTNSAAASSNNGSHPLSGGSFGVVNVSNNSNRAGPSSMNARHVNENDSHASLGNPYSPPATPLFGGGAAGVGSAFAGMTAVRSSPIQGSYLGGVLASSNTSHSNTAANKVAVSNNSGSGMFLQGFVVGGLAPESSSLTPKGTVLSPTTATSAEPKYNFNSVQLLRLLLIRCDAYSATKQHDKGLADATVAVEISHGQHAEAYFSMGRELRKLFRIRESVNAFDTGEALLLSAAKAYMSGSVKLVDGVVQPSPESESDFWALRGYQLEDVKNLGFDRSDVEAQEALANQRKQNPNKTPNGGAGSVDNLSSTLGSSVRVGGTHTDPWSDSMASSIVKASDTSGVVVVEDNSDELSRLFTQLVHVHGHNDAAILQSLTIFGMAPLEYAMWRRLGKESRALAAMRRSHTAPLSVSTTTIFMMDRRIATVRGGVALIVENSTSCVLKFIGFHSTEAVISAGFSFAELIPASECGVALLQPKSNWSGFSGCACYEVREDLCLFVYYDSPFVKSTRLGAQFVEASARDARRIFAMLGEGGNEQVLLAANANINGREAVVNAINNPQYNHLHSMPLPHSHRKVKVSCYMHGNQTMCFSLTQTLPVTLRSVELLPALEYAGPIALKKLSAVSKRYRELVNNLPPPLFYGAGRRSYPDYCVPQDRLSVPWTVRDHEVMTWRLVFDGRVLDNEEYVFVEESSEGAKVVFNVAADAQSRSMASFYYGDRRCPQLFVKESWVPFSSTLYMTTPLGRTLGTLLNNTGQGQCVMCLHNLGEKDTTPFYTARKGPRVEKQSSRTTSGSGGGGGGNGGGSSGSRQGSAASVVDGRTTTSTTASRGPTTGVVGSSNTNTTTTTGSNNFGFGSFPIHRADQYSVWRPQRVSGASTANTAAAHTNHGAELVAEIAVLPPAFRPTVKGTTIGQIRLLPGADALLSCTLMFCLARSQ